MIFEYDGIWVCALRLYCVDGRLYYIEVLEIRFEYIKKGYAAPLLAGVIDLLKNKELIQSAAVPEKTQSLF